MFLSFSNYKWSFKYSNIEKILDSEWFWDSYSEKSINLIFFFLKKYTIYGRFDGAGKWSFSMCFFFSSYGYFIFVHINRIIFKFLKT